MAVDYQARKAARKLRKRESVKPRRERKKKQARRLCRGPCFKDPGLTAEDVEEAGGSKRQQGGGSELARYAHLLPSGGGGAATEARSDKPAGTAAGTKKPAQKSKSAAGAGGSSVKRQRGEDDAPAEPVALQPQEQQQQGVAGEPTDAAPVGKRPKFSTSVSLLDAHTAAAEAAAATPASAARRGVPLESLGAELRALPELLQRILAGEGITEAMPVQKRCWPALLAGKDVEGVAEPGSGKTLGYLLPAAALLEGAGHGADTRPPGPLVLVMAPTRELAQQVASSARGLRTQAGLRTGCVHGGEDKRQQAEALAAQAPHLLVATPGRLLDLVQDGAVQLGGVQYVVLDEADKMLGLGFQPQVSQLHQMLLGAATAAAAPEGSSGGRKRVQQGEQRRPQVGLFTATMPLELESVAAAWLHKPTHVHVSHSAASISRSVTQVVQVCAEHKKPAKLAKHLEQIRRSAEGLRNPPRVVVFTNRIKAARFLHGLIKEQGWRVALLHGERSQQERDQAVADFRGGKAQVLVATDVAARGLHIQGLPYVVLYDFPGNLETYIHRVGRTGRLAAGGHAYCFFTRELARLAQPLLDLLQAHEQAIDPNLVKLSEAYRVAAEKLGLSTAAAGEAAGDANAEEGDAEAAAAPAARPQRGDVLRELGLKTRQEKKKGKLKAGKRGPSREAAAAAAAEEGSDSEDEADTPSAPAAQHRQNQQQQQQEAAPAFVLARRFQGTRQGYVFKLGASGLGYYLDAPQQRARGAGGSTKKGGGPAAVQLQQLKQKYARQPIGGAASGGRDGPNPPAGAKKRSSGGAGAAATAAPEAASEAAPKQHLLPGQMRRLQRQQDGEVEDASVPATASAPSDSKRRAKALPGRLRKKLARQHGAE